MSRHLFPCFAAILALVFVHDAACGDQIKLVGGGVYEGKVLDEKSTEDTVVIQKGKGQIKIPRSSIQEIIRMKTPREEYEEIRGQYPDTAAGQFKLAEWCEDARLLELRDKHLARVIELDPNHAEARLKLGYELHQGQWLTKEERFEASGLVPYKGRYVTEEQRKILQQRDAAEELSREWYKKLRMWRGWLDSGDQSQVEQAKLELRRISDPMATEAILAALEREKLAERRSLYVDALGNLVTPKASIQLAKMALEEELEETRQLAAEKLVGREDRVALRAFLHALKSRDNTIVRRAAVALGILGDGDAILPLINALVTTHKQIRTRDNPLSVLGTQVGPQQTGVQTVVANGVVATQPVISFQANGVGIASGSKEIVEVEVENEEVLDALEILTDQSFGYDQKQWRDWYATKLRQDDIQDSRRRRLR